MARFILRVAQNFAEEAACIENDRVVARLQMLAESLCGNPAMGTPIADSGLQEMFGPDLYSYPIAAYEILYRFDGTVVEVLGLTLLPPGR